MYRNIIFPLLLLLLTGLTSAVQAASRNQQIYNAIQDNDVSLVEQKLAKGLDPNHRVKGHPILVHAINANRIEMVKLLLLKKTRFEDYIFRETIKGNERAVNRLLAAGANLPVIRNKEGETLLMVSAREGHDEIVKTLVLQGADANAKSKKGHSAMTYSSRYGHLSIVQYLLNHGAEVNIANNNGWTPLLKAARGGHLEVVDYLLAHDANMHSRNSGGLDALALARRYKHKKVIKYLKDYK